jgi:hypothetical protein
MAVDIKVQSEKASVTRSPSDIRHDKFMQAFEEYKAMVAADKAKPWYAKVDWYESGMVVLLYASTACILLIAFSVAILVAGLVIAALMALF